jgi:hypothetical protein
MTRRSGEEENVIGKGERIDKIRDKGHENKNIGGISDITFIIYAQINSVPERLSEETQAEITFISPIQEAGR